MQHLLVAIFFVPPKKKSTQNDVVGGLKNPPYLCITSGKKNVLIIYAPRMIFWGALAPQKIYPK